MLKFYTLFSLCNLIVCPINNFINQQANINMHETRHSDSSKQRAEAAAQSQHKTYHSIPLCSKSQYNPAGVRGKKQQANSQKSRFISRGSIPLANPVRQVWNRWTKRSSAIRKTAQIRSPRKTQSNRHRMPAALD